MFRMIVNTMYVTLYLNLKIDIFVLLVVIIILKQYFKKVWSKCLYINTIITITKTPFSNAF